MLNFRFYSVRWGWIGGMLVFLFCGMLVAAERNNLEARVDSVLQLMTLEEKVGQLNQLKGAYSTDIYEQNVVLEDEIRAGRVGAITPSVDMDQKIAWQKIAVDESRLGIPLIYSADVLHGYKTIFPVPIAQAASWDLETIELAERIAAIEMSSQGLHWTFAPMVDVSSDPRWGRVMEGPGEDPYLAGQIARAEVRGFQGDDLSQPNTVLACAKHFAAYGAPQGGMEYNAVDVSERELRETYLPSFHAAVDEGVATIMNAFNTIARVPSSCNPLLLNQILKTEWGFQGFTVSDANSLYELIPHGVAADKREAALKCILAGSDTDLWGQVYMDELAQLVRDGLVPESLVDASVRRVLRYKFDLGLFDDPYLYFNFTRRDTTLLHPAHKQAALDLARKSLVLLKNEGNLLPLQQEKYGTIALIGPLADSRVYRDLMGNWAAEGDINDVITIRQGLQEQVGPGTRLLYAKGCEAWGRLTDELTREAVATAHQADVVVLALGEHGYETGECASKTDISLPGDQEKLARAIYDTGKPVVLLLFNGRPLTMAWESENIPAILECWEPGTMAGKAVADVLFGEYNPSGKLPITFPLNQGQIPISYRVFNTGRPRLGPEDDRWGVAKWSDAPNEPLYPFGFGLSYTTFEYGDIEPDRSTIGMKDTLQIHIDVTNAGDMDGEEIVQLYIRDLVADVSRPLKELKGFRKVFIRAGETRSITFRLTEMDLRYWNMNMEYVTDPGEFMVMVGPNSVDLKQAGFVVE